MLVNVGQVRYPPEWRRRLLVALRIGAVLQDVQPVQDALLVF
jgi:hypothetical protein